MRIIAKAHLLLDEALEELDDLDDDLVARCEAISAARAKQGEPQADPAKPLSSAHRRTNGAHAPGGGSASSSGTAALVAPGRRSQREAAASAASPDEEAAAVEAATEAHALGATSAVEAVTESAADDSGRVAAMDTGSTSADATATALGLEPGAHKGSGLAGGDTETPGTAPPKPLRPVKSPASAAPPLELVDIAEAFSLIDANGDGVLSRAEVIKACRANERVRTLLGLPKNIRQEDGTRDSFEEVFQKFDADDSKSITLDEFSRQLLKSDAADKVEAVPKPAPAAAAKAPSRAPPLFDCARLEGFCEGVVSSTAGWSVEHLSALLCDLYAVVAKAQRPALAGGLVGADPHVALELALSERQAKVSL